MSDVPTSKISPGPRGVYREATMTISNQLSAAVNLVMFDPTSETTHHNDNNITT